MKFERQAKLDSRIDTDTGEFDMVMATEGEASDGHVIGIDGLSFGDDLPLQLDHGRSTLANLGTVGNMRRDTIGGLPVYRGVGRIRLTGDGEALAARRDIVDGISRGDITGTSLTWESLKHRERRALPASHRAHVGRSEKDHRKRFGLFFDQSRGVEQSIVAIPSDKQALIGRAENATDENSRAMWQSLVSRFDDAPRSREAEIIDALEIQVAGLEKRLRDAAHERASDNDPDELPSIELCMRILSEEIGDWRIRNRAELDDALGDAFERVTGVRYGQEDKRRPFAQR